MAIVIVTRIVTRTNNVLLTQGGDTTCGCLVCVMVGIESHKGIPM